MRPALSSTSSSRFPFHPRRSSANTSRRSGSPVRSRDGEWLRLRVGPRGGFQRRTRRHLRQVLLHSVAQIWHGDTFQRDNVGVLCQQPQSFVIPPGNSDKLRRQLHFIWACGVFPV
ncbi:Cell growth defect factor 2 [Zea mays]|uniref:Cell growth defect factor 2 n=1 Tax=Zea mays TaxID=4577 RepID=A0A1D6PKR4_MAIZE|nr:Cell growth defect factor 2 [Zea mays]